MTQVVTVHTDFTDLNQMAQGLVGRVNDTHVILPGPDPVDVGEWVEFAVTLYDGTPGFAGVGRCVTVVDNGEERLSHQRFDVVIDSLQFDSRGQQVFEHILTLNGAGGYEAEAQDEGFPSDGAEEASFEDVSEVYTESKIELPSEALEASADEDDEDDGENENTVIGDSMQFAGAAFSDPEQDDHQRVTPVPARPVTFSDPPTGGRSALQGGATPPGPPVPSAAPPPAPSIPAPSTPARAVPAMPSSAPQTNGSAMFVYTNGLPFPAVPPRPDLDPSRRVSPAPRPRPSGEVEMAAHDDRQHRSA